MKKYLTILSILLTATSFSQNIRLSGNIGDTSASQKLPNVLLMVIRFTDSTLINFSRTDKNGIFKTLIVPRDTYIVIISHPNFNDKTYLLVPSKNDTLFNFKNVKLPEKSVELNEVEVIAYKDKMYYKGDTLQFTADSFKVKPDATVEDLLKKLPGIKVDAAGKITIQGKVVDQVLVDGDEFFGTDPTIATKNLNANTVETVQVFDKKNENTENGGDETVKVVNLKLKDDAKKGYFGKLSAASDFKKFYENEMMLNKFKNNRKFSVFGLFANTPKQAFAWRDANQFGLSNEGGGNFDSETNSWTSNNNSVSGVPQTLKSGFYFNDKFGKNTKINSDYTFGQNKLLTGSQTNTQFFLQDTNYTNAQVVSKQSYNQSHNFGLRLNQKLDSLTELTIKPKLTYNNSKSTNTQNDDFISQSGDLTRQTTILNRNTSETIDASLQMKLSKNFMKKDRNLTVNYQPSYYTSSGATNLNTAFKYYKNQNTDSSIFQKKETFSNKSEQNGNITYTEPWTKKFRTETVYGISYNQNKSNRKTLDFNGLGYDLINTAQSNDFRNTRVTQRIGNKFIYDVKKYKIGVGVNYRNILQQNINVSTSQTLSTTFHNVLPFANVSFRINQGSNLSARYTTNAQQPNLQQLQPITDNTDPNRIIVGNPALKPQYSNNFSLDYYFYKGLSDVDFFTGAQYNNVSNEISEKTIFDLYGKSITTPVNVNGNYFGNLWCGGGFPVLKRWMKLSYNFSGSINNNVAFVNEQQNVTQLIGLNPSIGFEKKISDVFQIELGGNYNYNIPKQTISLQSNKPYYTYGITANAWAKLPKNIRIAADGQYTNNGNRSNGYNIDYFILNAQLSKAFFKAKNFIVSAEAYDILNQNINNQRTISANKIIDSKTQIIKRYFLLRLVYKFTNQKEKEVEEDEDD